jgi:hypothetical protein
MLCRVAILKLKLRVCFWCEFLKAMGADLGNSISNGAPANITDVTLSSLALPSKCKLNALLYLPIVSGSLSLIGSSLILVTIFRNRKVDNRPGRRRPIHRGSTVARGHSKEQTSHAYHRIMIAMSLYDIVYTLFSAMFGAALKPKHSLTQSESRGHGTQFTCTLQGFFLQWGFGSFGYGAWLSVYYLLTIRYNVQEAFFCRYIEPIIHSSVFVVYFGTALAASILGLMNPTGHAPCWIAPFPVQCTELGFPCTRGQHYRPAVLWMIMVPSCTSVTVILVCLSLVAATVCQQRHTVQKQNKRFQQPIDQTAKATSDPLSSRTTPDPTENSREVEPASAENRPQSVSGPFPTATVPAAARESRSRQSSSFERLTTDAIVQCVLSGSSFVNSVFWINLLYGFTIAGNFTKHDLYWVRILRSVFYGIRPKLAFLLLPSAYPIVSELYPH